MIKFLKIKKNPIFQLFRQLIYSKNNQKKLIFTI